MQILLTSFEPLMCIKRELIVTSLTLGTTSNFVAGVATLGSYVWSCSWDLDIHIWDAGVICSHPKSPV